MPEIHIHCLNRRGGDEEVVQIFPVPDGQAGAVVDAHVRNLKRTFRFMKAYLVVRVEETALVPMDYLDSSFERIPFVREQKTRIYL